MILPVLFIAPSGKGGKGVYTSERIRKQVTIEVSPVIVMTKADRELLDKTLLHDYIFEWGTKRNQCCLALGYVSMYNHSYQSNCEYLMDYDQQLITVKTIRAIQPGEELCINYNGDWDNGKKVWFEAK